MSLDYFIGVNASEIERLRTQHEAWRPETDLLMKEVGFNACRSVLDLGCGPGFTTLDLAQIVGPSGSVCAVDKASSYLAYLTGRARELALTHVSVQEADVRTPGSIAGTFDGAFCRWFLAFCRDDMAAALGNIRESLRPGGVFAAMEYLTLRSVTSSPPSAAFDANTRAWIDFYAQHGGDSTVGAALPQQLTAAGFRIRSLTCVGGMADPRHRWWAWWGRLIADFGPRFLELGLLQRDEWELLQKDWERFSRQPDSFIYTPILLQVIAERR